LNDKRDIIEPSETDDLVRWATHEMWDGMSDGGRAAWMCGYLIPKLRRRAPRARLETIVRTRAARSAAWPDRQCPALIHASSSRISRACCRRMSARAMTAKSLCEVVHG
jgi:hypothetical protein